MILIECPACESQITASLSLPEEIRCDDCAVAWAVTDPQPREDRLAA